MGFGFGDILNIVSTGVNLISGWNEADEIEERGEEQAAETIRVAGINAENVKWAADANAALMEYDAQIAEWNAGYLWEDAMERARIIEYDYTEQVRQHMNRVNAIMGQQEADYAKAGVAVSVGSPVDAMAKSAYEGAKDADNIKWRGSNAKRQVKTQAFGKAFNLAAQAEGFRRGAAVSLEEAARKASLIEEVAASGAAYQIQSTDAQATATRWGAVGSGMSGLYQAGTTAGWWG